MTDHAATVAAFVVAGLSLAIAFVVGGLHFSPRLSSPLNAAATLVISTLFIVLASVLLVWGVLHLGFAHAH